MSDRKLGTTFWLFFPVHDTVTQARADALATAAYVFEDGTDTAILTPAVTQPAPGGAAITGLYRFPVAATLGNGFEYGKSYNAVAIYTAPDGGGQGEGAEQIQIVERFTLDSKLVGDLNDLSATNVQAALTSQGFTTARAPKLDKLDVLLSTRALDSTVAKDATVAKEASLAPLTNLDAAVTSRAAPADLGNLDVAVSTRLPSNDARLDNLDAAISTCATPTDIPALVDIDASLSAAHGAGSWQAPAADITSTLKKTKEVLAVVKRIRRR